MKQNYFKRLLFAAMVFFGFTAMSFAGDTKIKIITTDGGALVNEEIYATVLEDDGSRGLIKVQLNSNGEGTIPEKYEFGGQLAIKINGSYFLEGIFCDEEYEEEGQNVCIYHFYKLRLNSQQNTITNIGLLNTNTDYYLPRHTYFLGEKKIDLYEDTTIDVKDIKIKIITTDGGALVNEEIYAWVHGADGLELIKVQLNSNGEGSIPEISGFGGQLAIKINGSYLEGFFGDNVYEEEQLVYVYKFYKLRLNSPQNTKIEVRSSYSNGKIMLNTNTDYYLPRASYYIGETEKVINLYEDTIIDVKNTWELTVNVVDTDGKPADDVEVRLSGATSKYDYPKNGKITWMVEEGQYQIKTGYSESMSINVQSNTEVTITVPKMISFDVTIDGMTVAQIRDKEGYSETSSVGHIRTLDYEYEPSTVYKEDKLYSRLDPNTEYRMYFYHFRSKEYDDEGYVKGSTKITDGCTIRIGTFNVQTEGEGLAFPREEFAGNSSYKVFVGNPVRLAAVPVGDKEFVSWTINGKEYANPMMDFTVKDDITTATAKFSGEILTQVKAADSSIETISVQVEGNYLVLPADVEATASMYSADGRLVKRTGVVGNKININDLPASAYILRLNAEGLFQTAQFVKK